MENKLNYIDAVRGWAILLVITCHVGAAFAELPYPIKKITNFGWHGVQLFFLASAVTLMMSWHRKKELGWHAARDFFMRRFFRIAPMYYAGAIIYFVANPPNSGFDPIQAARSLLFVNAWHPDWIPTTGGWMVVPGGWSIGVEFTFYAIFPVLALLVTNTWRSLCVAAALTVFAFTANKWGAVWLTGYDHIAVQNFLYFWFPNQAPVFLVGISLYHFITKNEASYWDRRTTYAVILAAIVGCAIAAENPEQTQTVAPMIYIATCGFYVFFYSLSRGCSTIFVHKWMKRLGVLSFSCYILHFIFIERLPKWLGVLVDVTATGYTAIGMFVLLWVLTMICTVATAAITYRVIEKPGIDLSRWLTARKVIARE